jgi:hypothetical protein
LGALLEQLVDDRPAVCDARALAEAVVQSETEESLDSALDAVISDWRQA